MRWEMQITVRPAKTALDRLLGRGVDPRKRVVENQDIRSEEPAWRHCSTR